VLQGALSLAKPPEVVKMLLDAGADVNAKHKESGCGMVALAIDNGKKGEELTAVVKMLVEKGADVNCARPSDGFTALHLAARKGMKDVMEVLLTAKGVDVNQRSKDLAEADLDNAWPPLFFAVSRGSEGDPDDLKVAEMLLAKGADVKAATKENITALYLVANSPADHKDIAELLLNKGAEIDPQIKPQLMTPLHSAVERDNVGIVQFLLEKGADINIPNDDGVTIIRHARAAYLERPGGKVVQAWADKHPEAVKASPAGAKTDGQPAKEETPKKDDANKKIEDGVKKGLKGLFGR
jgi:ankyrin repeat protein